MNEFRIISLCPSTTYSLCDLGLESYLVGKTLFCIHPDSIKNIPTVGGTKTPNIEKIKALNPSHILFNLEENDRSYLDALKEIAIVIETTPTNLDEMYYSIIYLGRIFHREEQARLINFKIKQRIKSIELTPFKSFRYIYLIWNKPIYSVGESTFIHSILSIFGARNAVAERSNKRYPTFEKKDLSQIEADILFLSSEPYPFKEKHIKEYQELANFVLLINGEDTSWHGSFILKSLKRLERYFLDLQKIL